jgi:hypothetical protein
MDYNSTMTDYNPEWTTAPNGLHLQMDYNSKGLQLHMDYNSKWTTTPKDYNSK